MTMSFGLEGLRSIVHKGVVDSRHMWRQSLIRIEELQIYYHGSNSPGVPDSIVMPLLLLA